MKFVAKTLFGLEQVLAAELAGLGCEDIVIANRAVFFSGGLPLLYKVNYMSRAALSFLLIVKEFRINSADDLYRRCLEIQWDEFTDEEKTISVSPVVNSKLFNHSGYAGLKLKDAVADYFRNSRGKRPDVDSSFPDILINLHISNDRVTVSLDSSVIPLFKRGYRLEQAVAPLNEVLAAGMLMLSGWNATSDLLDPMCGSGTILVEAALIATNTPPGKFRKSFGFQKWKGYNMNLFTMITEKADSGIRTPAIRIYGSDISEIAVDQAAGNIRSAGLSHCISLDVADFKTLSSDGRDGVIFINPPYGERLKPEDINTIYSMIGTTLKHNFHGHTAWIISSNRDAINHIGLKPKNKQILFNGAIECMFLKYDLYQGSHKDNRS